MTNQSKLLMNHESRYLMFFKSLPWLDIEIHGSKIFFYHNIFLFQYCVPKCLVWIRSKAAELKTCQNIVSAFSANRKNKCQFSDTISLFTKWDNKNNLLNFFWNIILLTNFRLTLSIFSVYLPTVKLVYNEGYNDPITVITN